MKLQEVILYKSAHAYYQIKQQENNSLIAELQQYDGNQAQMPPRKVIILKGNAFYQPSLVDDVCKALGRTV